MNLYYDVARFLVLDGGKLIDYAKIHGFHKSKVHRIVGILVKKALSESSQEVHIV